MAFEFFSTIFKGLLENSATMEKTPEVRSEADEIKNKPKGKFLYARMLETDEVDSNLPPPVHSERGRVVDLVDIPFESTRETLIEKYLLFINQYVKHNKLNSISNNDLSSHYLFIQSLLSHGDTAFRSKYSNLSNAIAHYLHDNDNTLWKKISSYQESSEFPVIEWLKHNNGSNFIRSILLEHAKDHLTSNEIRFIEEYKKSPAFFFPDSIYFAWLAHSYEKNSSLKPFNRGIGGTEYFHDKITDNLLMRTARKKVVLSPQHYYQMEKEPVNSSFRFDLKNSRLLRIQGRTILFLSEDNNVIAVKVQKSDEAPSVLNEEFQMADYLQNHQQRLELRSQLPKPLGRYTIKRSEILDRCKKEPDFEAFSNLIADESNLEVYVYSAPLSYFTYLHNPQLSLDQFSTSVKKNVNDLFKLLREGIVFPQLADIFHTHSREEVRNDKGRYQTLVQLLRVGMFEMGRIDKWQKAVEFINLRESGLADLGDSISIKELLKASEFSKHYYGELLSGGYHSAFVDKSGSVAHSLFTNKRKLFGNYLYLNIMAEYLLVIQLAIGTYGDLVSREMSLEAKTEIWKQLSDLMFSCCAQAVTLMTGIPENRALSLLKQRANSDTHSKQTQFWMTPDYANLDESSIRLEQYPLYPGESVYDVRESPVDKVGLSTDGIHQDLGGYNQGSPLKELEKLLYATVTLIEDTKQLDSKFLAQLDKTERLIDSDAGASACYHSVAALLELSRPGTEFQKRLAQFYYKTIKEIYPDDHRVDMRFKAVEKENAALTILRFWREHPIPKETQIDIIEVPVSARGI